MRRAANIQPVPGVRVFCGPGRIVRYFSPRCPPCASRGTRRHARRFPLLAMARTQEMAARRCRRCTMRSWRPIASATGGTSALTTIGASAIRGRARRGGLRGRVGVLRIGEPTPTVNRAARGGGGSPPPKTTAALVHTLNTQSGLCRKAIALGIVGTISRHRRARRGRYRHPLPHPRVPRRYERRADAPRAGRRRRRPHIARARGSGGGDGAAARRRATTTATTTRTPPAPSAALRCSRRPRGCAALTGRTSCAAGAQLSHAACDVLAADARLLIADPDDGTFCSTAATRRGAGSSSWRRTCCAFTREATRMLEPSGGCKRGL